MDLNIIRHNIPMGNLNHMNRPINNMNILFIANGLNSGGSERVLSTLVNQLVTHSHYNINVICYGLRTDFKTQLFPGSKRLFELADSIEEIKSSCFCNSKTSVNARLDENRKIITDGEQIEVGGDDKYVSLCRKCYFEKTRHRYYKNDNNE